MWQCVYEADIKKQVCAGDLVVINKSVSMVGSWKHVIIRRNKLKLKGQKAELYLRRQLQNERPANETEKESLEKEKED